MRGYFGEYASLQNISTQHVSLNCFGVL